jgi:hypothetical protein
VVLDWQQPSRLFVKPRRLGRAHRRGDPARLLNCFRADSPGGRMLCRDADAGGAMPTRDPTPLWAGGSLLPIRRIAASEESPCRAGSRMAGWLTRRADAGDPRRPARLHRNLALEPSHVRHLSLPTVHCIAKRASTIHRFYPWLQANPDCTLGAPNPPRWTTDRLVRVNTTRYGRRA